MRYIRLFKSARLWSVLLVGAAFYGGALAANRVVPHQHLPWQSIDLNAEIGWATRTQLLKLSLGPREQCVSLMQTQAGDTQFTQLPQKSAQKGCGWSVALEMTRNHAVGFTPPAVTTLCPLAAASHIWLREIDAIAVDVFGTHLAKVHHFGTYSCRTIAGTSRLSEHAFANAWDVSGFELADGRVISVLKDWNASDSRKRFLRRVRDAGCDLFRVTLSPDYNAAHADHFHLDMGPSKTCR